VSQCHIDSLAGYVSKGGLKNFI